MLRSLSQRLGHLPSQIQFPFFEQGGRMSRWLTIVADDYGIGPETSRGILDLAKEGVITASVAIINCADAPRAIEEWKKAAPKADLGWHPNLTLDAPVCKAEEVPSLVRPDGTFWPLNAFLKRICLGKIKHEDVYREWSAQYHRFIELVGYPPLVVNSHQHVSLFPPADKALLKILGKQTPRPYLRRVVERIRPLFSVPGARIKRMVLSTLGSRVARKARKMGLSGSRQLIGVTDHGCVTDERFWTRWLDKTSRRGGIEICCHPGYYDTTLTDRDCDAEEGLLRRPRETDLLRLPTFREAIAQAGLVPVRPSQLI